MPLPARSALKLRADSAERQRNAVNAQQNQMEPLLVVLQPKEALAEDKPHEGEEFGYVISGTIQLRLGENVYRVKAGESFYFSANKKHSIANTGAIRAKLIWVSTPPTF